MTTVDDELTRARRALDSVSGELGLTWGEVLDRVEEGREVVPVVPLGGSRRPRRTTGRRVAVAAVLVAVLAGGIGTARGLVGRSTPLPPAGTVSVATPDPVDSHGPPSSDAAQLIVDRVREAFRTTAFCGATLRASDPRTALALDRGLAPTALDDDRGKRGRLADGELVAVDATTGTWWKLGSAADIVADRPDLRAGIAALQLLVDKGGTWRPADDGTPDAITTDVGDVPVTAVVDPRTGLPAQLVPASSPSGLTVTWLTCDASAGEPATVTIPPGYVASG